jgi:alginate O-acetyltransferase complex protein AlgJ
MQFCEPQVGQHSQQVSAWAAWSAIGGFLVVLFGVPVWQIAEEIREGGEDWDGRPQVLAINSVIAGLPDVFAQSEGTVSGRLLQVNEELLLGLQDYETAINESTWLQPAAQPLQRLLSAGFRRGTADVVQGQGGWLYLGSELRALTGRGLGAVVREGAGSGWSRTTGQAADPRPAILQFHQILQRAGVTLLLVPVPAKASVCPEGLTGETAARQPRVDVRIESLLKDLAEQGIQVVDLHPIFLQQPDPASLYCRTDTHLSGSGVVQLAGTLADELQRRGLCDGRSGDDFRVTRDTVEITGDLSRMLDADTAVREQLELQFVVDPATGLAPEGAAAGAGNGGAPVLLLGDSHLLVYDAVDLHAVGAGLPQHVTRLVDAEVETLGVRGSGGTGARLQVLQDAERLSSLRVVVWCFAAREFLDPENRWQPVLE